MTSEKNSQGAEEHPSPLHPRAPTLFFAIALGLLAAAALVRFWIVPQMNLLPTNYASELQFDADDNFRETPDGEWMLTTIISSRVDQTIVITDDTQIIQSDLHWYNDTGQVIFENTGLYGVDRRTRMNVIEYGDTQRTGQFFFPLDVQPTNYTYWDPMFIGPRLATFEHAGTLDGLSVYVFRFNATGLDETVGYSFLPDVPERYTAHTDGEGTLWIEPTSGIVVDYAEHGMSYFTDSTTGKHVADFHEWRAHYTPETRAAQLRIALQTRLRMLAMGVWLPSALLATGVGTLGIGLWRWRRNT